MTARTDRGGAAESWSLYRDEGCRLHPKCLECPEPVCVYDHEARVAWERQEIARLHANWWSARRIAETLHLAVVTVSKEIQRIRAERAERNGQ